MRTMCVFVLCAAACVSPVGDPESTEQAVIEESPPVERLDHPLDP